VTTDLAAPEIPFFIDVPGIECWVVELTDEELEDDLDEAWVDWRDGEPHIAMREYDERVLLHEVMHVVFKRDAKIIAQWVDSRDETEERRFRAEEGIVRALTAALFGMGWRWRTIGRAEQAIERDRRRAYEARENVLASVQVDARGMHEAEEHAGAFEECVSGACGVYVRAVRAARS